MPTFHPLEPRFRALLPLVLALGLASGPLTAGQVITQDLLDQTLLDAQTAIAGQDYEEAFTLYDRAARWGHKGAQYVVGELYLEGKGVARDPVAGYAWLTVAAEAPDRDFRRAARRAGQELNGGQKAEAERLANEIAATYGMEAVGIVCKKEARVGSNIKSTNCYHRNTTVDGGLIVPGEGEGAVPAS